MYHHGYSDLNTPGSLPATIEPRMLQQPKPAAVVDHKMNERRVASFLRQVERSSRYSKSPAQVKHERKRDQQRIHKRLPSTFQLRPPTKMLRAAITSTAMSRSGSSTDNASSSSTPSFGLDSGYLSGHISGQLPFTPSNFLGVENKATGLLGVMHSTSPSAPADPIYSVEDYHASMAQLQDGVFGVCYVNRQFTHDPKDARTKLAPIIDAALDRLEDRPQVTKVFLHLDFKNGRIRGSRTRKRLKRMGGAVNAELRRAEGPDYINVRGYHNRTK